jgi:hypothetical protein
MLIKLTVGGNKWHLLNQMLFSRTIGIGIKGLVTLLLTIDSDKIYFKFDFNGGSFD